MCKLTSLIVNVANTFIFSQGQHCQVYYPESCDSPEGPKHRKSSLVVWYFVQHHPCCVQGGLTTHITLALSVNLNSWFQAGRLTNEAREIRAQNEKHVGGDNARESRLRALHA